MTPKRPYFLRAFYDWITDNNYTVHLVVDAEYEGVEIPRSYVENGKIVLNASMQAVQNLVLENDAVSFSARFSGKPHNIYLPIYSILGIYAAETGDGIVLSELDGETPPPPQPTEVDTDSSDVPSKSPSEKPSGKKRPPHLKVVK